MIPFFPQITPNDAKINFAYKHVLVNYAFHSTKSLKGFSVQNTPFEFDFYIERLEEMRWQYNVLFTVNFNRKFRFQTYNGFVISGGYEDLLYRPGTINSVVESSRTELWKKVKAYAKLRRISNVPDHPGYYDRKAEEVLLQYMASHVEKAGLVSNEDPLYSKPCLKILKNANDKTIYRFTYSIIDKLLNHPDFDIKNNAQYISKAQRIAHVVTIKQKCLFNLGEDTVTLNVRDAVLLSLHVELAMQCVAGQIWNKLKPLMRKEGFTEHDETGFIKHGRDFFNSTKNIFKPGTVENYDEIPLWDEVLQ